MIWDFDKLAVKTGGDDDVDVDVNEWKFGENVDCALQAVTIFWSPFFFHGDLYSRLL